MGKIFVGQTGLRFTAKTRTDITGALTLKILYKKPSVDGVAGAEGEWIATSLSDSMGIIYYDIEVSTQIDTAGDWRLRSYVQFSDSRDAKGEVKQITVYEDEF